jgi:hypothetical protein
MRRREFIAFLGWEMRGVEETGKNFEKINRCSSFWRVGVPKVIFPPALLALPTHSEFWK